MKRRAPTSKRLDPELLTLIEQRDGIERLLLGRAARLPLANLRALKAKHAAIAARVQRLLSPLQPPRVTCAQPDRDVSAFVCGYPLPCPHHTAVLEISGAVVVPPALSDRVVGRLRQVARAVRPSR